MIMNILTNSYTINLPGVILLTLLLITIVLIALSLLFIQDRLSERQQKRPKTGFLGKPLLQFSLLAVTVAAIVGAVYLTGLDSDILIEADKEIEIQADYTVEPKGNQRKFEMNVVPIVDGEPWSTNKDTTFDIIVNIQPSEELQAKGQDQVDVIQANRTEVQPASVNVDLLPGEYAIKIIISFDGESYQEDFSVNIF